MSYSPLYFTIICAATLLCCVHFSFAWNNETDKLALLEIKAKIINDPLGVLSSWNDTLHLCEWYGVICGRQHQRVTVLNLGSSKLLGNLSPYVGNLSFLRGLNLQNNSFSGVIPSEVGHLRRLQSLRLHNNTFEGYIPRNISACHSLTEFFVSQNRLVGGIPSELSSLSNLQYFDLAKNNLTGTIPSSLGNFSSLLKFYTGQNNLVGTIPESLGNLKILTELSLSVNQLSGIIPPSIFNLTSIEVIDLGFNFFQGNLQLDLSIGLPNLQWFSIYSNKFNGSIPTSLSNFSNLEFVQLGINNFDGQVPSLNKLVKLTKLDLGYNSLGNGQFGDLNFISSLANCTGLQILQITSNNFKGAFPTAFCNFSMLSALAFAELKISGQIPSCIENLAYLNLFVASSNELSGFIPQGIGKLQNLNDLELDNNQLSGVIPSSVGNLTELIFLQLSLNNLEGQIPAALGNCKSLLSLILSNNHLSGKIPPQIFQIFTLSRILDLSENHLTGPLPEEVGQLTNLAALIVSVNMLSGEIPSTLGACLELQHLYMDGNQFKGAIPDSLSSLRSLIVLDVSQNNLSGDIPDFLVNFSLQILNLSYNNLEGSVPVGGIFSNATSLSIIGNNGLCGGMPELNLPKCNHNKNKKRGLGHKSRILLALLSGVVGILLMVTLLSLLYVFWYKKRTYNSTSSSDHSEKYPKLSYQSIFKATNGFSFENLIGRGTFGTVYKGILDDQDTPIVAVKIFNIEQHGSFKSFMVECDILRSIRHRNLVKVITACSSMDYQGNDFKALVYEYMVNGSLEDWLHQEAVDVVEHTNKASRILNFQQRLDIGVDVASALEYLHYHCGSTIVHCDLKPSNVLLDEEMVAHVSDFGLAKFLSKSMSDSHANQSSSLGVRGTIGYACPEYGLGNEVSTSGDVYSFGILLLEMFTGKRPTDEMFNGGISLHHYVKEAFPERVTDIIDPTLLNYLLGEETNRNTENILEGLISIFRIATTCSAEVPHERLDISDVVVKLSSIRNKLLKF